MFEMEYWKASFGSNTEIKKNAYAFDPEISDETLLHRNKSKWQCAQGYYRVCK